MTTLPNDLKIVCPKCGGNLSPRYGDNTVYLKCDTCSYARCIDPDGDCGARPVTGVGAEWAIIVLLLVSLMIAAGCRVLFALAMGGDYGISGD